MRKSIRPGTELIFKDKTGKSFIIESLLSEDGSSSLVYIAYSFDMLGKKHFSVLKQLYPQGLDISLNKDDFSILVPEKSKEAFELYKSRFIEAYNKQVDFQQMEEAGNKPSEARGIYDGYNTLFIEMQYDRGYCYNSIKEESLQDIFITARAVAKAVNIYHDNGLLHLDVKPANIFILKETKDYIKVFDYDSVVSKKDIELGNARLSFSARWAAPELLLMKYSEIGLATDFYSIGAIVFNEIFGQTPASKDLRYDSKFNYSNNKLFEKISPAIYNFLTEFFHRTLQATPSERYKNDAEIIEALDRLVCASSPVNIYLSNHTFSSSDNFIGRGDEFDKIEKKLHTDRICFIHGMGGIGKTEIAKQFANRNRNYYHTVHAIKYSGDLKKDILDMDFINLDNKFFTDEKGEIDIEKLYKFKKDKIQESDERTLIIIDNFNTDNDQYLRDIITHNNGHHTLFTTKNEVFQKEQYYIEIKELSMENSLKLFYSFFKDTSQELIIIRIIDQVQRNTLGIKLIASTMQKVNISPKEMLAKLQNGIENDIAVRIKHNRDILGQNIEDETLFNHLCIVFDTAKLSKQQKYLLKNMWFVSQYEISNKAFLNLLQIDYTNELINTFNTLLEQNWINVDSETNAVSLHPIVSAVVKIQLQPDIYNCAILIKNIIEELPDSNYELLSLKQKISLGEELLRQNQIPIHFLSLIFYGLSIQYNNDKINIKKSLEYGKKADQNYCKLKHAKKSIENYIEIIQKQEGLLNVPDSTVKLTDNYYAFLALFNLEPVFSDDDEKEKSYKEFSEKNYDFYNYKDLKILIQEHLALLYFQIQQYTEALKYIRRTDKSPDMLLLGGKCQYYIGDYDNAISIFEKALLECGYSSEEDEVLIKCNAPLFSGLLNKIQILMYGEENEDLLTFHRDLSPADAAECLKWIAYCFNKKGNTKKSLHNAELIEELLQSNDMINYETNMLIADIYEINGEYEKANSLIFKAKSQCKSLEVELNTFILIAQNNMKTLDFCESIMNWKKAGEIAALLYDIRHQTNFEIAMNIGNCYFQINEYELAQSCYENLYEIYKDADYNKILITKKLAKIHATQNHVDLSENLYDSSISSTIELLGENAIEVSDLYYEKAMLYLENDIDKAIANLEKCLDIRKGLLHMEDRQIVICQQELLELYQKKHDDLIVKGLKKTIKKAISKIDLFMLFSFLVLAISSAAYLAFEVYYISPVADTKLKIIVFAAAYSIGMALFILTFKSDIKKFTNNSIILCITFLTIVFKCLIMISAYDKTQYTNLTLYKIICILRVFDIHNSFYLLPLIILTWFTAYNGLLTRKPLKIFFSLIFTFIFSFIWNPIILGIFFFAFVYFLRKNTKEKWIQLNDIDMPIIITFAFFLFLIIFSYALISVKHTNFVNMGSPISILQSLNLFSVSSEPVMLNLNNYPILNLMIHAGIFSGLLLTAAYFAFVILSIRNAKRIKSGYIKIVYQTICVFFLLTGAINIFFSIIDAIGQTYLSKVLLVRSVMFPFLSPDPIFLICCFFFGGILFSIYFNRGKE